MRPVLRETLEGYQGIAHDRAIALRTASDKRKQMKYVRDYALDSATKRTRVSRSRQEKIFDLQQEKDAIMEILHEDMDRIEQGFGMQELYEQTIPVSWKDGKLVAHWHEKEILLTSGQMVADLEWDLHYKLDPTTVPKRIQKRYALERAREELWKRADQQVATFEDEYVANEKKYRNIFTPQLENVETNKENIGFVAERMTFSLLKRIEHDIAAYQRERGGEGSVEFQARHADVHQDVYQKMDFIIALPEWLRGAKILVEENATKQRSTSMVQGFQLTINENAIGHKTEQIDAVKKTLKKEDRIRDIAVILLQHDAVYRAFQTWNAHGRPPGGPCEQLTKSEVKEIVEKLFINLFPERSMRILGDFIDEQVALDKPPADAVMPEHRVFLSKAERKKANVVPKTESKPEKPIPSKPTSSHEVRSGSDMGELTGRFEEMGRDFGKTRFSYLERYWDLHAVEAFLEHANTIEERAALFMDERKAMQTQYPNDAARMEYEHQWDATGMKLASLKARIATAKRFKERLAEIQDKSFIENKVLFEKFMDAVVLKKAVQPMINAVKSSEVDKQTLLMANDVEARLRQAAQTYLGSASTWAASGSGTKLDGVLDLVVACGAAQKIVDLVREQGELQQAIAA